MMMKRLSYVVNRMNSVLDGAVVAVAAVVVAVELVANYDSYLFVIVVVVVVAAFAFAVGLIQSH